MLRHYAGAKPLFAFTRNPQPITQARCRGRATETGPLVIRSLTPRRGRSLNLATLSLAPLESAATRRASMPGFVPDDAHGPSGMSRCGGPGGHPSVVAGLRDMDVRASRRRSARSQGRRRAVKQGCPSVARAVDRQPAATLSNYVAKALFAFTRHPRTANQNSLPPLHISSAKRC